MLKAATDDAHGGSLDVYLHEAGEQITLPAFADVITEFVIEEYLHISRNWGLQLYVGPDAQAHAAGHHRAAHRRDRSLYRGQVRADHRAATELIAECVAMTQRAADAGYRGVCSLDCAQTQDGQLASWT